VWSKYYKRKADESKESKANSYNPISRFSIPSGSFCSSEGKLRKSWKNRSTSTTSPLSSIMNTSIVWSHTQTHYTPIQENEDRLLHPLSRDGNPHTEHRVEPIYTYLWVKFKEKPSSPLSSMPVGERFSKFIRIKWESRRERERERIESSDRNYDALSSEALGASGRSSVIWDRPLCEDTRHTHILPSLERGRMGWKLELNILEKGPPIYEDPRDEAQEWEGSVWVRNNE